MKRRSLLVSIGLFCLSLLLIVSCTTGPQTSPDATSSSPKVSLGFSAWPGWFPWQITADKGIFVDNKVKVDLKWFDGYLESINALNAKQLDANSQTLGDTVSSLAGGADLVIVLVNDHSTGNDKIIVREGINSIQDLKGKKVAAEEGTVDHFLLLQGLKKAGMKPDDIEFVPLETGQAATAFVGGQVDAVGVFPPFTTQALKRSGSKTLFTSKDFPGSISDHLVVTRDMVEQRPEQVQALVNSWFATLDFMAKNPDVSTEIMAKRAGVTIPEYQEYADGTKIFTLTENIAAFQPGDTMNNLPFAAEQFSDFLMSVGLIQEKPDLSKLFDDQFVKAAAAKAQPS
ncbi:ABC transporter substrate-binding protein [Thermosynechococcaceae cyanobacterium BACA0444]|uniref:ABC transporter substrate-binding protein n=1 Tax=Pseudocalidococcus azoricus BACA0444 TaxID=2918990 RepID=A0AAE4FRQ2_9CYAN|nr:ABC transporter substrate-binding protein [Pseudocalidococcus azoricus]MDS3859795.1 ABC transporter substrate-binding protein [Pseudocalidococcus azoricus BACA0444]